MHFALVQLRGSVLVSLSRLLKAAKGKPRGKCLTGGDG